MTNIREALEFTEVPHTMWTDSSIVLDWLRKPASQLKQYVANRVGFTQQHSEVHNWRHIRTRFNPADCASHGISADALINHQLWWHGPTSLNLDDSVASDFRFLTDEEIAEMETEMKPVKAHTARASELLTCQTYYQCGKAIVFIDLLERFSRLGSLKRATAYILRFQPDHRKFWHKTVVSTTELDMALLWHIRAEQKRFFAAEIHHLKKSSDVAPSSKLASLAPYLDSIAPPDPDRPDREGKYVLRGRGRLEKADLDKARRFPILLPRDSTLTRLIANQAHIDTLHGSIKLMLQTLRGNYWIVNARSAVKKCLHSCVICRRHQHAMTQQRMASLPRSLVVAAPPFSKSGVDYCGPFNIRIGSKRTRTTKKTWVAIFVCMATKAVHIELAEDLSAEAFINLYTRFVNRGGPCHHLYCDNGTAFVGANRIMQEDLREWHGDQTQQHLANNGTTWHFLPPAAPHQGGLWEAAVKLAKKHLVRVAGIQSLYYDQLHTLLIHIEACLNSRPLIALHDDFDDRLALTPADFLIGRSLITIPDVSVGDVPTNRLTYWQQLRQMQQHFWIRWHDEYLSTLQQRSKWHRTADNLRVNDVVIIRNENLPATQWRLGRIMALHPGDDGLVRVVTIKHQGGECTRPVQKVCKLTNSADAPDTERDRSAGQDIRDSN